MIYSKFNALKQALPLKEKHSDYLAQIFLLNQNFAKLKDMMGFVEEICRKDADDLDGMACRRIFSDVIRCSELVRTKAWACIFALRRIDGLPVPECLSPKHEKLVLNRRKWEKRKAEKEALAKVKEEKRESQKAD